VGATAQPVLEEGSRGLDPVEHGCSCLAGVVGHHLVDVAAAHHESVAGQHRVLGPHQLHRAVAGGGPQAVVAVEALELGGQAHLGQLVHRPRRQGVSAGLVTRERLLLDDHHVVAGPGQPVGGGGAGGTTADHEHVTGPGGHGSQVHPPHPAPGPEVVPNAWYRRTPMKRFTGLDRVR
jgi:hypothetical protein